MSLDVKTKVEDVPCAENEAFRSILEILNEGQQNNSASQQADSKTNGYHNSEQAMSVRSEVSSDSSTGFHMPSEDNSAALDTSSKLQSSREFCADVSTFSTLNMTDDHSDQAVSPATSKSSSSTNLASLSDHLLPFDSTTKSHGVPTTPAVLELLKIPLVKYGWIREFKKYSNGRWNITYSPPNSNVKLRGLQNVKQYLIDLPATNGFDGLSATNFSFTKRLLGCLNENVIHNSNDNEASIKPKATKKNLSSHQKTSIDSSCNKIKSESSPAVEKFEQPETIDISDEPKTASIEPDQEKPTCYRIKMKRKSNVVQSDSNSATTPNISLENNKQNGSSNSSAFKSTWKKPVKPKDPVKMTPEKNGKDSVLSNDSRKRKLSSSSDDETETVSVVKKTKSTKPVKQPSEAVQRALKLLEQRVQDDDSQEAEQPPPPKPSPRPASKQRKSSGSNGKLAKTKICEQAECSKDLDCSVICAECLLRFHVQCATEKGRLKKNAKNAQERFVCHSCYPKRLKKLAATTTTKTASVATQSSAMSENVSTSTTTDSTSATRSRRSCIDTTPPKVVTVTDADVNTAGPSSSGGSDKKSVALIKPTVPPPALNFIAQTASGYKILKHVFRHLSAVDLLKARHVCSLWNDVAMMPEYWRVARLKGCHIKNWTKASDFLKQQQVTALDFYGVKTSVQAFTQSLKDMDYVKGLHFGHVVPVVLSAIKSAPRVLARLEQLRFTITEQRRPDVVVAVDVDFDFLSQTSNLKQLRVTAAKMFRLRIGNIDKLRTLCQLTELVLLDLDVNVEKLACLKSLSTLTVLKIGPCSNWTSRTFETLTQLKQLEKLSLESGELIPNDYLSSTIAVLPRLSELVLVKFSTTRFIMDIAVTKRLRSLTIWPDFSSRNCCATWKNIIDGFEKQKHMINFGLGIASRSLVVLTDSSTAQYPAESALYKSTRNTPTKFAVKDDFETGLLKMVHLDDFVRYAKRFVPNIIHYYVKDDNAASTRSCS